MKARYANLTNFNRTGKIYKWLVDLFGNKERRYTDNSLAFLQYERIIKAVRTEQTTKTQQANEVIKSSVLSAMEANRLYSISEMLKEFPDCKDMSNQKLSSLVRQMVLDKQVERIEGKRKAFFRKVSE